MTVIKKLQGHERQRLRNCSRLVETSVAGVGGAVVSIAAFQIYGDCRDMSLNALGNPGVDHRPGRRRTMKDIKRTIDNSRQCSVDHLIACVNVKFPGFDNCIMVM